ncbi:hypothetical protein OC845_006406 [Tilletia horrida]|nr:hypothetical protein OC845_006406 [Tilletia horrida]
MEVSHPKDALSLLPVELLINIFDCLPVASLVFSLGPVSSRLAHIVEQYIRLNVQKCLQGLTLSHSRHYHEEGEGEGEEARQRKGQDASRPTSSMRAAPYTLCFEARRPIDTTATTHELHFDGFEPSSTTSSEAASKEAFKAYSTSVAIQYAKVWNPSEKVQRQSFHLMRTMAVFSFVGPVPPPPPQAQGRREPQVSNTDDIAGATESTGEHENRPTPAPAPVWQALRQPFVPTVPTQFAHRMRERDETSSIVDAHPSNSDSASVSTMMTSMMEEELRSEVDAYDWAPARTVGSSSANVLPSGLEPSGSTTQLRETQDGSGGTFAPAYRCQLDPLDSFETFLLSLSLKTTRPARSVLLDGGGSLRSVAARVQDAHTPQRRHQKDAVGRAPTRVFERRVASGCDRVMRTWFAPVLPQRQEPKDQSDATMLSSSQQPEQEGQAAAAIADRRLGSFQVLASTFGTMEMCVPRSQVAQAIKDVTQSEASPPVRQLEIDGASCTIDVRPQPSVDSMISLHPSQRAGASGGGDASSAAWLFMSPFAYQNTSSRFGSSATGASAPRYSSGHDAGTRVELKFNCTKVRVRAARLLAMLHRLEDEVLDGERRERVLYFGQHQRAS